MSKHGELLGNWAPIAVRPSSGRRDSRGRRRLSPLADLLEARCLLSAFYDLAVLASTGDGASSWDHFGDLVAINDSGQVGYVGFTDKGSGLWISKLGPNPQLDNINPGFSDSGGGTLRDFGRGPCYAQ